jgi:hypothetical protein
MIRCADFGPIPFIRCISETLPLTIAAWISAGLIDDNIILAVFGPIPEIEIKCKNNLRSPSVAKP